MPILIPLPLPVEASPPWLDFVVKLTPAFVTLVIGIIGSIIAYQQYCLNREQCRINSDKLRLDLFSKRLDAYEKLQEFFMCVLRTGTVQDKALPILAEANYKSRFLFDEEIGAKLDEIWNKAVDLQTFTEQIFGPGSLPVGPERTAICQQKGALLKWMMKEMEEAPKRYSKYLHFK